MTEIKRNATRTVKIGSVTIGGTNPIAVQSMAATKTQDIAATLRQIEVIEKAGADLIRIAVDSPRDVVALEEISKNASVPLSVDLQENYRLVEKVAPHVDKVRYNPGHLYHHEKKKSIRDKVAFIVEQAVNNDCAIRIGVNCGSVDPDKIGLFPENDSISPNVSFGHRALRPIGSGTSVR